MKQLLLRVVCLFRGHRWMPGQLFCGTVAYSYCARCNACVLSSEVGHPTTFPPGVSAEVKP